MNAEVSNVIAAGSRIELHFALRLPDNAVVDSTFGKQPASCTIGDGSFLPGFEEFLLGLRAGDKEQFQVPPEKAFGMPNPNNVQRVRRDLFDPDLELHEGLVVSFADAAKAELPGVIKSFDERFVEVDFNHPLAGQVLTFEVEILAVERV